MDRRAAWLLPLFVFCTLLGCKPTVPAITFDKVPLAAHGGKVQVADISGRVTGAKKGQHIVVFAKSDVWWFQSGDLIGYTEIQPDGTWTRSIHLGWEYAAMLVDASYRPPPTTYQLPAVGGQIAAVAAVAGTGMNPELTAKAVTIAFSGYRWNVRTVDGEHGGRSHPYDASNVRVDDGGRLHLRMTNKAETWTCSEVEVSRSLGYGTYRMQLNEPAPLEPAVELSFFTWGELGNDSDHHEMDINLTQKGDPRSKNVEYTVQPYYLPMNMSGFTAPSGLVTYSFDWEPEGVSFSTWKGDGEKTASNTIWEHTFHSNVPVPGGETLHINLCVFGFPKVPLQHDVEVLIPRFEYLP